MGREDTTDPPSKGGYDVPPPNPPDKVYSRVTKYTIFFCSNVFLSFFFLFVGRNRDVSGWFNNHKKIN